VGSHPQHQSGGPRVWVDVANQQLAEHGDEGYAIREANEVVTRYRDRG